MTMMIVSMVVAIVYQLAAVERIVIVITFGGVVELFASF